MLLSFTHTTTICKRVVLLTGRRSLADRVLLTAGDKDSVHILMNDQHLERSKPYPAGVQAPSDGPMSCPRIKFR